MSDENKDVAIANPEPQQDTQTVEKTDKEINFEALRKAKAESDNELKKLKAELKAKQETELLEQGKLKELAELKQKEAETYKQELDRYKTELALTNELTKSGANAKFLKFIKFELEGKIEKDGDGNIININQALSSIKSEYPDWFVPTTFGNVGTTVTQGENTPKHFTPEQIADPNFYKANRDNILKNFEKSL